MACKASMTVPVTTMADFSNLCEAIQGLATTQKISIVVEFVGRLSEGSATDPTSALATPLRIVFSPRPEPSSSHQALASLAA